MFAARRLSVSAAMAVLSLAAIAHANNRIWTGQATPDDKWTTLGNWNLGVPASGDTAFFNSAGNGNTTVSLGGAAQPIGTIEFDNGITPSYTLGVLGSGDKFNVDTGGSILVTQTVAMPETINADLHLSAASISNDSSAGSLTLGGNIVAGGTLTVTNSATTGTTTLGGNISEIAGQPASLTLSATGSGNTNNNFVLTGTNSYTGGTTISVNDGTSGSIQLGSNSPFGSGLVSITLFTNAPQFSAVGGDRTIPNAFKLNGGMVYVGTNSLTLAGTLTVFNPAAGGGRTLANQITAAGKSVTLGSTPNSSTITLGGADGIGKTLFFSPSTGATTVVNDVIQDPAAGGGTASGIVQFIGSTGGVTRVNGLSTYTGGAFLGGSSTVQVGSDYNPGDPSGPFGIGTLTANSATNNVLEPVGGNRTIANPVSMLYGITVANAPSDNTSSLTLAGPITMSASGRFLTNNLTGGTLTLGSAASPSTLTLPTSGSQLFTLTGSGQTVINDVIQDASPAPTPAANIELATSTLVTLNSLNTYAGNTALTGLGLIVGVGASSNALPGPSFTAGPFGTGALTTNNVTKALILEPVGANRSVSNSLTLASGFTIANAAGTPYNLSLNGPITLGATNRLVTNNLVAGVALTLGSATTPSTLSLGSTLTLTTQTAGSGTTIINDVVTGVGGLTVQGGAVVQLNNAANDYAGATVVMGTGTKFLVNGAKTGAGTVTVNTGSTLGGTGTIGGAITNNGTIAPGAGVGTLTTTGNVTMAANSHLAIDLGGGLSDKLAVGGSLDLSNNEFLDIAGSPSGLSFVIASYTGTLTGTFNHVTTGYTVNYGTGTNSQITLSVPLSNVKGDFNNNGRVDAADYVLWRDSIGSNTPLSNDNGLGTPIGQSQYDLWRSNFNKPGSGSGALQGGEVPEPTGVLLAILGIMSVVPMRRRGR